MWYKDWFNCDYYHILYCHRDEKEAEDFLHRLTQKIGLQKGMRILDLPCGRGRHSIFLEKEGFDVTGADLAENSIEHARRFETEHLHFRVHNMLDPFPEKEYDAVLNLFTSLGYFDSEQEDLLALNHMADALKQGGWLVIDFLNPVRVQADLIPEESTEIDGIHFDISREIKNKRVVKSVRFNHESKDFEYSEKVRLYDKEELSSMVNATGLQIIDTFGDYNLQPWSQQSERCIIVARKN
jgi:SAM-dependent methyltransferase